MSIWFYVAAVLVFITGCRFGIYLAELPVEPVPGLTDADTIRQLRADNMAKEAEIQRLIRGMS